MSSLHRTLSSTVLLFIIALTSSGQTSFNLPLDSEMGLIPEWVEVGFGTDYYLDSTLIFDGTGDSGRTYLQTTDRGFYELDFVAEVQFIGGSNIFFMGLGQSSSYDNTTDIGLDSNSGPVIGARLHSDSVGDSVLGTIDHNTPGVAAFGIDFGVADTSESTNLLRFTWNGATHTGYFELDTGYSGVFDADYTSTVLNGADNSFTGADTFIYFGGSDAASVSNFSVSSSLSAVPEPSAFASLAGLSVLGWSCLRRPRRALAPAI